MQVGVGNILRNLLRGVGYAIGFLILLMPLTRELRPVGPHKLLGKVVAGFKRGSKQVCD